MPARLPRPAITTVLWWSALLLLAAGIKHFYSLASETDLQWMLRPLATMSSLLSGLSFDRLASGQWLNADHGIAIVKSCAGLNFLVLALLALGPGFVPKQPGAGTRHLHQGLALVSALVLCLLAAWLATMMANGLRIVLAIKLYQHDFAVAGLDAGQIHRLTGLVVYYPALFLLAGLGQTRVWPAAVWSVVLYLGMVIVVPLVTGNYRLQPALYREQSLYLLMAVPLVSVLLAGMKLGLRGRPGSARRKASAHLTCIKPAGAPR